MQKTTNITWVLRTWPLSLLLVLPLGAGCQSLQLPAVPTAQPLAALSPAPPATDAFTDARGTVRREALAWWSQAPRNAERTPLPDVALPLQRDPDPRVRAEFAEAVIRSGHSQAVPMVLSMLDDQDIQVRLAALSALGNLPHDHPQRERACDALAVRLNEQSGHGEKIRAAAAGALARLGQWDEVRVCLDDSSWRVRLAVAQQLSNNPHDALPVDIGERLVRDTHPAVQRQLIDAVAAWPVAEAVPLWLVALESDAYQTRVAAHGHLSKLWPAAAEFPYDARSAVERESALAALNARWEQESQKIIAAAEQAKVELARQDDRSQPRGTLWTSVASGSQGTAQPVANDVGAAPTNAASDGAAGNGPAATANQARTVSTDRGARTSDSRNSESDSSDASTDSADGTSAAADMPPGSASAVRPAAFQPVSERAVSPQALATLRQLLRTMQSRGVDVKQRQDWAMQLTNLGDDLLPLLEALHGERVPVPEFVYQDVLPEMSPIFRSLAELSSPAVDVRRRAAVSLRAAAQAMPLSPLAIDRLASLAEAEQDALVWQSLVDAAGASGTGDGAVQAPDRFWRLALEHPQSEVRRRACEHVGRLRRVRVADALATLADDEDSLVARAAARALGHLGPQTDSAALEKLLASRDHGVRVEAAASLCKAGMHAGEAAIARLSYDPDPKVRMQVAEVIGELSEEQFIPILIRFLDDARSVQRAALLALPKVAGRDVAAAATASDGTPPTIAQQVAAWKAWENERRLSVRINDSQAETAEAPEKTQLRLLQ